MSVSGVSCHGFPPISSDVRTDRSSVGKHDDSSRKENESEGVGVILPKATIPLPIQHTATVPPTSLQPFPGGVASCKTVVGPDAFVPSFDIEAFDKSSIVLHGAWQELVKVIACAVSKSPQEHDMVMKKLCQPSLVPSSSEEVAGSGGIQGRFFPNLFIVDCTYFLITCLSSRFTSHES